MAEQPPLGTAHYHQHAAGLFAQAQNTAIFGGTFSTAVVNHTAAKKSRGFKYLRKRVAKAAFHNSKQRLDPPRCHENTRQVVLQEILDWITANNVSRNTWIAWLHGAAGAGKSAICQSIAELCIELGIPVASFFFFRADATRNIDNPLVATLAYQIVQQVPETKEHIVQAIEANPLIFQQSLATQFRDLIVQPLRQFQNTNPSWKLLLIIDGLDECTGEANQTNIIRTLSKLIQAHNAPFRVLFGSRSENHIQMAFNVRDADSILHRIPLDNHYAPEADIHVFLADSFTQIKETHPLGHRLNNDWPAPEHVQHIIDKSSGQFIYASVVIKFISFPSAHPAARLEIVRGLRPSGRSTPFAELDALYRHIFSQVEDLHAALGLIAYAIFKPTHFLSQAAHFFTMTEDDAYTALAHLPSITTINLSKDRIDFLHASLPDFLLDLGRSQEYCINKHFSASHLSVLWLDNATAGHFHGNNDKSILNFLKHAEATPDLQSSLLKFRPSERDEIDSGFASQFLTAVRRLEFNDGGETYRRQLYIITRYIRKHFREELSVLAREHNVSRIVERLDRAAGKPGLVTRSPQRNMRKINSKRLLQR